MSYPSRAPRAGSCSYEIRWPGQALLGPPVTFSGWRVFPNENENATEIALDPPLEETPLRKPGVGTEAVEAV